MLGEERVTQQPSNFWWQLFQTDEMLEADKIKASTSLSSPSSRLPHSADNSHNACQQDIGACSDSFALQACSLLSLKVSNLVNAVPCHFCR